MESCNLPSEEILKQAIMELKEPVLFQQMLQDSTGAYTWNLLEWNLLKLAEKFGDIKLPFRVGYNARSVNPQWETQCSIVSMTLSEFIQNVQPNLDDKQWYYFDYKYMEEWFKDNSEIIDSLNWNRFGFNKTGSESTLWIGSKGAHTNCHQDSYGCNLVAQIHGRKQWLLFPPSSSNFLGPTRVPYEESTVYSKFNFFCPTEEIPDSILKIPIKPKLVILEPGDVLLVPPNWWHYVESLDFSISVNVWLPVITDSHARIKEAIVKLIVSKIGKRVCATSEESHCTLSYCMKLLDAALKEYKNQKDTDPPLKRMKRDTWTAEDLAAQYPTYVNVVRDLEISEFERFLTNNRERYSLNITESMNDDAAKSADTETSSSVTELSTAIVNALCHPDVVNKVTELLLTP